MAYGYTAYQIDELSRAEILARFPPVYEDVIADHVTHCFGVGPEEIPAQPVKADIVGYHDSGAIQVLSVEIDGNNRQALADDDETRYLHITLSLDRSQGVTSKESNKVLQDIVAERGEAALRNLEQPVAIEVTATWIEKNLESTAQKPVPPGPKPPG